jgi:ABC-2 type transport system ATP-binding protein
MSEQVESLIVSGVSKSYAGRKVLDNINFKVNPGVVHGFLGPNGAGKSTTMRIIAGVLAMDHGEVLIQGHDLARNLNECKKKIGLLPENPPLYLDMVVADYLTFVADLYKVKNAKRHINDLMDRVGLTHQAKRLVGNLSKGYKQKVGVTQAMIGNPQILLLDEPTVGLDPQAVVGMRELIVELGADHTILVSSHLLHEISLSCQDITIIDQGKIVKSGPLSEIKDSFNSRQILQAKVSACSEEQIRKLEDCNFIEKVEVDINDLKIFIKTDLDVRREVSEIIVRSGMGLLEFSEDKMELEDIFIEITKQHGRSV